MCHALLFPSSVPRAVETEGEEIEREKKSCGFRGFEARGARRNTMLLSHQGPKRCAYTNVPLTVSGLQVSSFTTDFDSKYIRIPPEAPRFAVPLPFSLRRVTAEAKASRRRSRPRSRWRWWWRDRGTSQPVTSSSPPPRSLEFRAASPQDARWTERGVERDRQNQSFFFY